MSNEVLLIIMITLGIIAVILVIMAVIISAKNKKEKSAQEVFVNKKLGARGILVNMYDFLDHIPFFRRYLRILGRRYDLMYPGDYRESSYLTMYIMAKLFIVAVISLTLIFGLNPGVYTFLTALIITYIVGMEMVCSAAAKLEIKFLKSFDSFLCSVKHYFYKTESAKLGIDAAREECDRIMKGHAQELYKVMTAPDVDAATREYMGQGYHKFLKLFLLLAETVEEAGDNRTEKGSAFLNSIIQCRNDVQAEVRYIERRRHRFSGLALTAGLPLIAVPYIAWWGQDTIPSLVNFYSGHTGFIIKGIIMVVTIVCFNCLVRLREGDKLDKKTYPLAERLASLFPFNKILNGIINHNYSKALRITDTLKRLCEKYNVRTFYMLKCLYFCFAVVVLVILLSLGHIESRNILLADTADLSNISTSADGKQIEAMERVVPQYTKWIIENDYKVDDLLQSEVEKMIRREPGIRTDAVAHVATVEVLTRVHNYRSEIFGWLDCVVILVSAILAFNYPNFMLRFRKSLTENKMQDEVLQFQSLLFMLKEVPGMSSMTLLEQMENFAEIFKPSLQTCINKFNVNDIKALQELYLAEEYVGFRRIVDCFLMVDDMGIEDAFEEIASEITNFKENRELERQILLDQEGTLANILAVLPGGLILFGYLLCPFLVRSVAIFNSYNTDISTLT